MAHHRLVVSHNLVQAVTLPGLDFVKAWADCRLACIKDDGLEALPSLNFRDLLWDTVDDEGVLTDFDLDSSGPLQAHKADRVSPVAELLTCKAICDNRVLRLSRDQIEPYAWMITSTYLHALDEHE
ncbi:hypothetical protein C0993_006332 [Termitomyces sp. T159_Od127]|nr:hypothetical protein C0993_006332 [Termitomyces sp. T159_Od127]